MWVGVSWRLGTRRLTVREPSLALGASGGLCVCLSHHFLFQGHPTQSPFPARAWGFPTGYSPPSRCLSLWLPPPGTVVLTCPAFHVSSCWLREESFM